MANLYQAAAGMDRLERLSLGDSPVHRLHPFVKLITAIVYIGVVISFPASAVSGLVPFLLYPCLLIPASGTPLRPLAGRLLCALPFSLMGAVSNLILMRDAAFSIGGFSVSFGMLSFVSIMLKTFLTVCAVLLLIATTPFTEISAQLARLRVPKIVCLQLIMTYRYIGLLLREAASMMSAYFLRAPKQKGIRMKDMGSFLGQLILRSGDRSSRVYQAMQCRGFRGVYSGSLRGGPGPSGWLYTAALVSGILFLRFFNFSLFLGTLAG
ncbi:MAG: cobalt ECF transporter T component CbiQ [Spirochaetales bacterium]|jgi:cobalt/nickel transport system permease protein|nr:cobalt ECF transporter T component CbiQ [Spirochaetales bacterium]